MTIAARERVRAYRKTADAVRERDHHGIVEFCTLFPGHRPKLPISSSQSEHDMDVNEHRLVIEEERLELVSPQALGENFRIGPSLFHKNR